MRGKAGSGKGWILLKRARTFVVKYRIVQSINGKTRTSWPHLRLPRSVVTEHQASAAAEALITKLKKPVPQNPAGNSAPAAEPEKQDPLLSSFFERWHAVREDSAEAGRLRQSTLNQDRVMINKHIGPDLGSRPMSEVLSSTAIAKWVDAVKRKPNRSGTGHIANNTVRNIVNTLKKLLDDIADNDWHEVQKNPTRQSRVTIAIPRPTRVAKRIKIQLDQDALNRLFRCKKNSAFDKLRFFVAVSTGVRDGELLGLQWHHLELTNASPTVYIAQALSVGSRQTKKLSDPKTEHSVREIPLHPKTIEALLWWRNRGWAQWTGRVPNQYDFVFPTHRATPCRRKSAEQLRAALVRAGASPTYRGFNITAHSLRRTFSTMLACNPESALVKDELMGHSPTRVDARHYASASPELMARVIRALQFDFTAADVTNTRPAEDLSEASPPPPGSTGGRTCGPAEACSGGSGEVAATAWMRLLACDSLDK